MSVTIELPPDLESKLAAEANARGLSLPDYVLELLAGPNVTTGADLVKYWQAQGLIGTRSDIADSAEHARALRRQAETRERD